MRQFFWAFLFLTNIITAQNIDSLSAISNSEIITSSMIKTAGISTIAEIVSLKNNWFTYTLDGSTSQIYANNLTPVNRQNLIIFIDGQRFDIGVFDVQNLNTLPISIDQVDYVEFFDVPRIYEGEFSDRALIHFHTKIPLKGLSLSAAHAVGNETGDPGPFNYTKFRSENIDKLIYNFAVNISAAGDNWFLKGNFKGEQLFQSDPAVRSRIASLSVNNKSNLVSWSATLTFNALNGRHHFITGHTDNFDFFFFKPYGNEIPVNKVIHHYGLNGEFGIDKNISLHYELKTSSIILNQWDNNYDIEFDWGISNYLGRLECQYNSTIMDAKFGLVSDNHVGQTGQLLLNNSYLFQKYYCDVNLTLNKNISQSFGFMGLKSGTENSVKFYLSNFWIINKWNQVSVSTSASKKLFMEDVNYWSWAENNYYLSILDKKDNYYSGSFNHNNSLTLDLNYRFTYKKDFRIDISADYRNFSKIYFETQAFQFNPQTNLYYSNTNLYYNGNIQVAGFEVEVENNISDFLTQKAFYNYHTDIGGNELLKEIYKMFYTHVAGYQVAIKADDSFSIWTSLKYYSPIEWFDYRYIDYQTGGINKNKIDEKLLLDFSVQKWFWGKRIWANLLFKNILNEDENYHPLGQFFVLRFYFQVHIYFDSVLQ
ncbi:MAG: hypothetical protein V1720_07125 [bacterium]